MNLERSPVSLADFEQMKASVLFGDDDVGVSAARRTSFPIDGKGAGCAA
jgi:hypothetical protein